MDRAVNVLIIDEPPGLDPNFRAALEHTPTLRTIGEEDLVHSEPDNAVALVFIRDFLLDVACERIAALRETYPSLQVMVLFRSMSADELRRLLAVGAAAFVARDTPVRDVCTAIVALTGRVTDALLDPRDYSIAQVPDSLALTPREAEVLRFLSAGFSNKEVARRLSLSVRTVETHRLNLRRKTQTGRLKDLVQLARQLGLDPVVESDAPRRIIPH